MNIKYRCYSEDARKLDAFKHFISEDFSATEVLNDEKFLIIDWRGKNTERFSSRFIVDKRKGNLIITGIDGDCIASWHRTITPETLENVLNDILQFVKKIRTSSKIYTFDITAAEEDFRKAIKENIYTDYNSLIEYLTSWTGDDLSSISEKAKEEIYRDFKWDMSEAFDSLIELKGRGGDIPDDLDRCMKEWFGTEWYIEEFPDILKFGRVLNFQAYYWAVGFQMAYAQLYLDNENERRKL